MQPQSKEWLSRLPDVPLGRSLESSAQSLSPCSALCSFFDWVRIIPLFRPGVSIPPKPMMHTKHIYPYFHKMLKLLHFSTKFINSPYFHKIYKFSSYFHKIYKFPPIFVQFTFWL